MTTIGVTLPQLGPAVTADVVRDFAQQAEEMGFDHLWVQDHFLYALEPAGRFGGVGERQPDIYRSVWGPTELLAATAAWTTTIELGTSVLVTGNHYPAQLANRLATVDQLSGGRLRYIGLGVGWSTEEMAAMGVDSKTRGRRADDFVPALRAAWGPDPVEHHGPIFDFGPAVFLPKPVRPPLLLSGMWSEPGLKRTARDFDHWNPGISKSVAESIAVRDRLNAERPAGKAELNVMYRMNVVNPIGARLSIPELAERARACADAGFLGVFVDTNYNPEISAPADFLRSLTELQPILDAVRSTSAAPA